MQKVCEALGSSYSPRSRKSIKILKAKECKDTKISQKHMSTFPHKWVAYDSPKRKWVVCEVDKLKEMASRSLSSMLHFGRTKEDQVNQEMNVQQDIHVVPQEKPQIVPPKKRRSLPKVQCNKGFPRDQNLQLHKRGHNLPWKLKHKSLTDEVKRKVYLCPEPSCVNHDPSHALGDLTGIKKHYSRKHGEKKYKCQKCEKMYAVRSDLKAHAKTCGTREYKCHCDTIFSRVYLKICKKLIEKVGLGWSPNSGMDAVKRVALEAGAYGCTLNGAGPMVVAVTDNEKKGREIGEKMVEAFMEFETFGNEEIGQSWERR
ncbi:hypothetical protein LXL04_015712 [Taraxacum kok-saghyz]